jgi:hypothetical protein
MMVPSQGTMTLGAIAWGLSAQIAGTRLTLLAAAFLFCVTAVVLMLLFRISREPSGSPDELLPKVVDEEIKKDVLWFAS